MTSKQKKEKSNHRNILAMSVATGCVVVLTAYAMTLPAVRQQAERVFGVKSDQGIAQPVRAGLSVPDDAERGHWVWERRDAGYLGSFAKNEDGASPYFGAFGPSETGGKGATDSHHLGYRKTASGYESNFLGKGWSPLSSDYVTIVKEAPLASGDVALIITGNPNCAAPACMGGGEGRYQALINTPNGELPGGMLYGEEMTLNEFSAFLATISIQ